MGKNTGGSTRKEAMGVNVRAEIEASLIFKFDQIGTGLFNINISLISSETDIISINNQKSMYGFILEVQFIPVCFFGKTVEIFVN